MYASRQHHLETGVGLREPEQRVGNDGKTERPGTGLLDFPVHLLVNPVEVFVVVEDFERLFLQVLVAEPDGRNKAGGLAGTMSLPEGEAPLEECLREALVDACEFGLVVRNPEGDFAGNGGKG